MQIYLVGGAVRDELLKLQVTERDYVVVGSTPEEMLSQKYKQVGKQFPVFLHPETKEEYALARTEKKTTPGYYGFICDFNPAITLEEDLLRRDLTINAMAKDSKGNIIDPYNGQLDLQKKLLRHVSPAFTEDPVRILRIARFAARYKKLGFKIASDTMDLLSQMVQKGETKELVPERVWSEIVRALAEDNPEEFFLNLRACNALSDIFPALNNLWGIPQKPEYHPEVDTGVHTMLALKQAVALTQDLHVRFATLCHDLGKGTTPKEILPSHSGHESRGVPLIKSWCQQYKVPNDYRDLAVITAKWHLHTHKAYELRANTILKLLKATDALRKPDRFVQFLLACKADARGRIGKEQIAYDQADYLNKALDTVKSIDTSILDTSNLTGKAIGQKIHKLQLQALQQISKKS